MPESVNSKPDYYGILGAREDASAHDIERLYKRQAHKRHPDRGGAEEDMKALNEAYHVLRSAERRRAYDTERQPPIPRNAGMVATTTAPNVGLSGQLLSALLCILLASRVSVLHLVSLRVRRSAVSATSDSVVLASPTAPPGTRPRPRVALSRSGSPLIPQAQQ